jgi:hypothetical protein
MSLKWIICRQFLGWGLEEIRREDSGIGKKGPQGIGWGGFE